MRVARNLRHDVTHWPMTGSDGFGGFLFGAPVLLKGRWETKAELFQSTNNEEEISQSVVYLQTDISIGDYLGLGDHATTPVANPTSLTSAHRIRQRNKTTDLRNLTSLRKAFL